MVLPAVLETGLKTRLWCLLVLLPLICGVVLAQDKEESIDRAVRNEPLPGEAAVDDSGDSDTEVSVSIGQILDVPHELISNNVEWISRKLDMFFSNETIYEESSGSYIRFREDVFLKKGGDVVFDTSVRTKVELPKTRKKLQLLIRNEADVEEEELGSSSFTEAASDDYSTSLRRLLKMTDRINTHIDAGVKLRSSLDSFVRMRARVKWELDRAELNFVELVSWFDSEGWRASTLLEYRNQLFEKSLLRVSTHFLSGNRLDETRLTQTLGIYNAEHRNMLYFQISAVLTDKPNVQDSQYVTQLVYKNNIYKNWLYMTVGPQLSFRREDRFRTEPGLLFQLEANFGNAYRSRLGR